MFSSSRNQPVSAGEAEPSASRTPLTTAAELATLDAGEVQAGYWDGFQGEPEPGNNRSRSYWHGWRNGMGDRTGTVDAAQLQLARDVVRSHA